MWITWDLARTVVELRDLAVLQINVQKKRTLLMSIPVSIMYIGYPTVDMSIAMYIHIFSTM